MGRLVILGTAPESVPRALPVVWMRPNPWAGRWRGSRLRAVGFVPFSPVKLMEGTSVVLVCLRRALWVLCSCIRSLKSCWGGEEEQSLLGPHGARPGVLTSPSCGCYPGGAVLRPYSSLLVASRDLEAERPGEPSSTGCAPRTHGSCWIWDLNTTSCTLLTRKAQPGRTGTAAPRGPKDIGAFLQVCLLQMLPPRHAGGSSPRREQE